MLWSMFNMQCRSGFDQSPCGTNRHALHIAQGFFLMPSHTVSYIHIYTRSIIHSIIHSIVFCRAIYSHTYIHTHLSRELDASQHVRSPELFHSLIMSDKNKTNDRSVVYHTCIIFAHLVYEWILYSISGSSRSIPHTTPHAHMRKGFSKSIWSSLLKCTVYCRLQRWSLSKALSQTQMVAEPYVHTYIHDLVYLSIQISIYILTCCIYIHL